MCACPVDAAAAVFPVVLLDLNDSSESNPQQDERIAGQSCGRTKLVCGASYSLANESFNIVVPRVCVSVVVVVVVAGLFTMSLEMFPQMFSSSLMVCLITRAMRSCCGFVAIVTLTWTKKSELNKRYTALSVYLFAYVCVSVCVWLFRQNFLLNSDGGGGAFQRLRGRYVTKSGNLQELPKSESKFTGNNNNNNNNKRAEITVKAKCKRNASIYANLCNALGTDPVKIWANWPTVFIICASICDSDSDSCAQSS